MANRRRQTPESVLVRQIRDGLTVMHVPCFRLNSGAMATETHGKRRFVRFSWNGAPDLVVLWPDGAGFIEVKTQTGKLSDEQESFRDLCRQQRVPWLLARSWDDVDRFIRDRKGEA